MTLAPPRTSRLLAVLLLACLSATTGCTYAKDRLYDLSDVFDVKYGTGLSVAAKVEVTYYVGLGAGLGINAYLREWYGRKNYESYGDMFAHAVAFGMDGGLDMDYQEPGPNQRTRPDMNLTILNATAFADHVGSKQVLGFSDAWVIPEGYEVPPLHTRWRVGGEFQIPVLSFGLYLNFGELGDFLLGFFTVDYAGDDGIGKLEQYDKGEILPPEVPGLGYGEGVVRPGDGETRMDGTSNERP